jgi:uncharacterized membrane protein YbaN (DUF454 family)
MPTEIPQHRPITCKPVRYATLALGVLFLGLGIAGLFLPVMPTTVFLLLALWCFSRSSERLQRWLYDHPRFGHGLRQWHRHRVIPPKAKAAALAMMAASFLATLYFYSGNWLVPEVVGVVLVGVAVFILRCPSRAPA